MHDNSAQIAEQEAAVRAAYQRLMDGWNQGSGAAYAAAFTEDGDLVGFDGQRFRGRGEIAPFHQELFDKWLKGSRLVGKVVGVRFLSPDVALMHAVGGTIMRGKSKPPPGARLDPDTGRDKAGGRMPHRRVSEHQNPATQR